MTRTGTWTRSGSTLTVHLSRSHSDAESFETEGEDQPVLRSGSRGSAVAQLQQSLAARGYSPGAVDGIFGSQTSAAVRAFQTAARLTADGIVGPNTWAALGTQGRPPAPAPAGDAGPNAGKIDLDSILSVMQQKRYVVYTEPYRLNIVGIRNPTAVPNSFDDSINVFFKDDAGRWVVKSYVATLDPGTYFLEHPMNVHGSAIVMPGQYVDSHEMGLHRGEYTALVQRGPLTVIRDDDLDAQLDFNSAKRETGIFGINIHRANASGTSTVVDRWSAGCQVFASSSAFSEFIGMCQKHRDLYGNRFTYTLIPQEDLPKRSSWRSAS